VTITKAKKRVPKSYALAVVAATFFMVSGAPMARKRSYGGVRRDVILLFLPVLWCLPKRSCRRIFERCRTGRLYAWVRRGWGTSGASGAWALTARVFDMAIYRTLFFLYVKQMSPCLALGIMESTTGPSGGTAQCLNLVEFALWKTSCGCSFAFGAVSADLVMAPTKWDSGGSLPRPAVGAGLARRHAGAWELTGMG